MFIYEPDVCIYHGHCDDGFTAAWATWKRWPNIEFIPGFYGQEPPFDRCNDKRVLMVDFSYKRPVLEKLMSYARDITILDHHKTAQADLETYAILNPVNGDNIDDMLHATQPALGPIRAEFDMNRSGAMMAWQFAFPEAMIPRFVELVQDRDLWKFEFGEDTKRFSASLRTYPMEFRTWDRLIARWRELVTDGEAILRSHRSNIGKFLDERYEADIGGHRVPVVNVPYHYASDTAHELLGVCPDAPFAATWLRRKDGTIQFSLRSEDARVDVSEVAKSYGGGGHRNAAGFQLPIAQAMSFIEGV